MARREFWLWSRIPFQPLDHLNPFGDWTDVKHGNNGSTKEPIPFEIVTSTNIVQPFELHRAHRVLRASPFSPHDSSDRAILTGSTYNRSLKTEGIIARRPRREFCSVVKDTLRAFGQISTLFGDRPT